MWCCWPGRDTALGPEREPAFREAYGAPIQVSAFLRGDRNGSLQMYHGTQSIALCCWKFSVWCPSL